MDLPTYTNIWRIEKRLYKLYDLRLPMPLPIVWIGVFVGVLAPWSLLLWLVGVPFANPWHVLYLVPPGMVTWLSTRPVIENKRLTELMESQLRYLGEPRTWCRMAPASEPETITFSGRVWQVAPVRVKAPRKARHSQRVRTAAPAQAREVRPAVAAAAAAASHAPVTASHAQATETTPRWGSAQRRGTAPALGATALPQVKTPQPDPVRQAASSPDPVRQTASPDPVRQAAASPDPVCQAASSPDPVRQADARPDRAMQADAGSGRVRQGDAGPDRVLHAVSDPALPVADAVPSDAEPQSVEAPVVEVPGTHVSPVDAQAGNVAGAGAVHAEGKAARAAAKPIDTEALRRLRKLAATAHAETPAPTRTETPAPTPGGTTTPGVISRAETPAPGTTFPAQGATAAPGAAVPATAPPSATPVMGGTPGPEGAAQKVPSPESDAPAVGSPGPEVPLTEVKAVEAQPVDDEARVQHRKGQPPRQDAQRVWPPAAKPGTVPNVRPDAKPVVRPGMKPGSVARPAAQVRPVGSRAEAAGTEETRSGEVVVPVKGEGRPIQAVSTPETSATAPAVPVPRPGEREARVRRVESVVGRDSGGWRRIAQVVVGGGSVHGDGSEVDEARARAVFGGSRRIVVLGCTGGAGQSTTALMLGHTLAHYRDDRVLAVDASTGGNTLTSRIKSDSPETLTSLLSGLDRISGYLTMRAYTTRTTSGLEVIGADTDAGAEQRLADRSLFSDHRLGQAMHLLDRHYKLAVIDPAAALAARVLPYADQLVLVVPASEDAAEAVAMTYEWLDGHGCGDLRRRAVMVVNGVSRRSMADVEQAEAVASGRCRAIVRVPWEDDLAAGAGEPVDPGQLRAAGRRAYLALAGVVVAGFAAAQAVRPSEEELASDPPGTRIGER